MKRLSIYMLAAGMAALSTSCSDFLDTVPKDQLAPLADRGGCEGLHSRLL